MNASLLPPRSLSASYAFPSPHRGARCRSRRCQVPLSSNYCQVPTKRSLAPRNTKTEHRGFSRRIKSHEIIRIMTNNWGSRLAASASTGVWRAVCLARRKTGGVFNKILIIANILASRCVALRCAASLRVCITSLT